ncbi:Sua5/YciO/YrdC/YwlC family protein [Allochromatium palmeri]|uniref:Threonylcarbamoyl-AMP synthase n=1 Tax=Allochromatium palmeri TaxID=231048 RepID=A0A6N8E935_9GAMM|nr:Sua5/YciO/YrdC/YwlC family protein [Allochromatium palmeri]MTW19990.1 tRNA threonylcarbamoyladenosine biosynthesis protein RimN [Allochromatium palmeri]
MHAPVIFDDETQTGLPPRNTGPWQPCHRLRLAVRCLRRGGVIAYPTEAVYGLGCDPWNARAVAHLLAIKRRSITKGLILIASDPEQLWPFVEPLEPERLRDILATWPGPNTWLLPARATTPAWLTGRFDTLAVRVTAHPLAAALCQTYGGAIVSTSANQAARPAARTSLGVRLALDSPPDDILAGHCAGADRPSVIRDGRTGRVIRA